MAVRKSKKRSPKSGGIAEFLLNLLLIALCCLGLFFFLAGNETFNQNKEAWRAQAQQHLLKAGQTFLGLTGRAKTEIEAQLNVLLKNPSTAPPAPSGPDPSEITLCSFNIRIFSQDSRDDEELQKIASLLKECDVTGIQELRDYAVLRRTLKILGPQYAFEASEPVGRGVKEIYAFVYRSDKIVLLEKGRLFPDPKDEFIREPYFASFKAGNFDFTLLTVHILYGKNEAERRPELASLAVAYEYVQEENPQERDIIILGDFNFSPDDDGWVYLKKHAGMTHLIRPPAKTTITDTSLYDNFWFQEGHVREYSGRTGVVAFDETLFDNDDDQASLAVSDHRPIWAKFDTNAADDD
jgi:endonuclease/exonuclease/phosphatase family metal-dependent hydrolase